MASFGETLRRERELREISLRDIADVTKINLRYLEALEQNRFEILPGGLFNKGFIRAYARFIGADGEALVDRYLQELAARDTAAASAAPPGGAPSPPSQPGLLRPAEPPTRRAPIAPDSPDAAERRPDRTVPAAPGVVLAETVPGSGGAVAIPIVATRVATEENAEFSVRAAFPPRRLMPVMTFVGAAAVLVILFVGARSFRDSSARPPRAVETPVMTAPPDAQQQAAASIPPPDTAAPDARKDDAPPAEAAPQAAPRETPPRAPARPQAPPSIAPAPEPEPRAPAFAPPAQARETAPEPAPAAPAANGMEFRVEAATPVWVQVACDGEDRINRSLQAGEGQTVRCLSLVRISATDAGAVRLFVNGVRCVPIGDPGTRVEGFAIRTEDYRAICPPGGAPSDGRR